MLGDHIEQLSNAAAASRATSNHERRAFSGALVPRAFVSTASFRMMNASYFYARSLQKGRRRVEHYDGFFFPLDSLRAWNLAYGQAGFYQLQFVVESTCARQALRDVIDLFRRYDIASFVSVLKTFGDRHSGGILSFPRPGVTLAVDVRNDGEKTDRFLTECHALIDHYRAGVYLAKDAVQPAKSFERFYGPALERFSEQRDRGIASDQSRRLGM